MKKYILNNRLYFYLAIFCILALSINTQAQTKGRTKNISGYGIEMSFLNKNSRTKGTGLASNVLRIINNTNKDMELMLNISQPAAWRYFGENEKQINLKSKDSIFIPVRVQPNGDIKGDANYIVNASLSNGKFSIATDMWYIFVKKISNWNAYTNNQTIYFPNKQDSLQIKINLSNYGNSDESLILQANSQRGIKFIDNQGEITTKLSTPFTLNLDRDTIIKITLLKEKVLDLPGERGNKSSRINHKIRLKIIPQRESTSGAWSKSIEVYELPDKMSLTEGVGNGLPLTVDFQTYNIASNSTYAGLNLYGSKLFENNSVLNYYYQANFAQNQLNPKSFLGNNHFLSYNHKYFNFELGNIGAVYRGSTLTGKGAKASIKLKNNELGGVYVKSPTLFDYTNREGWGLFHSLKTKRINSNIFYQKSNNFDKEDLNLIASEVNILLNKRNRIKLGGGYSNTDYNWDPNNPIQAKGYGFRFGYSFRIKKLGFNLSSIYGSKNYTPARGMLRISSKINYRFNDKFNVNVLASHYDYNPNLYRQNVLVDTVFNKRDRYSININYKKGLNRFSFKPFYSRHLSARVSSEDKGLSFNFSRSSKKFRISTIASGAYSKFLNYPEFENIFISEIRSTLTYNDLKFRARYYYGPYYDIDKILYIESEKNPQKVYTTFIYDLWFLENKMRINFNINYNYTTYYDRHQVYTNPEFFYYAKNGFRFNFYSRYIFYAEGERTRNTYVSGSSTPISEVVEATQTGSFEIGMGVKFDIDVPTGINKYHDAKVVAFRDINGNGKMDINESGIENMLIILKSKDEIESNEFNYETKTELITNKEGFVLFDDVKTGNYQITAMPLTSMGGWFDGKTFNRTIDKNKTVYIPLSKGAKLSGGILVDRDKFSSTKNLNLSNIRVTAVNQLNGKNFSTLTGKNGEFSLFIPNGNYVIVLNEAAIGGTFQVLQNNIPLEVNNDFENYNISFYVVEKKRKLNFTRRTNKNLPIRRQSDNAPKIENKADSPNKDANSLEQRTQLEDPLYLPVVTPNEEGEVWLVQLYPNEKARMLKTEFDTLNNTTDVRCIVGENGQFLYISKSFDKKRKAKKLLKEIVDLGFEDAEVVSMVFGNTIKDDESDDSPVEVKDDKPNVTLEIDSTKTTTETPEEIKEETEEKEDNGEGLLEVHTIEQISDKLQREKYRVEVKVSVEKLDASYFEGKIPDGEVVYEIKQDGLYKYSIGSFSEFDEAKQLQQKIISEYNIPDAFVTQYKESW